MIRSPWNIPCEANTRRGALKHSWLENQILQYRPDNVVNRRRDGSWERSGKLAGDLENIGKARELARTLAEGFSPAQLVDRLQPLRHLPEPARRQIKTAVHQTFLERCGDEVEALAGELAAALDGFESVYRDFGAAWQESDDPALHKAWQAVTQKGHILLAVFEKLPHGVVLP